MSFRLGKPIILRTFTFLVSIVCIIALFGTVRTIADTTDPNPDEITLYFLDTKYQDAISIPSDYPTSYKIKLDGMTGTPTYYVYPFGSVEAEVSEDGVIVPYAAKWYWKNGVGSTIYTEGAEVRLQYTEGSCIVRVFCGDYKKEIKVNVIDYSRIYAEKHLDEIVNQIIKPGMTELEKLTAITKWVAENTDYSASYSSYIPMMILNCGDCWASSSTLYQLSVKAGLNARIRDGSQDIGSGLSHKNLVANCDGKVYVAEAGFEGTRPRKYIIKELSSGFSSWGETIYQYDGFESDVVIPEKIGDTEITEFGNGESTVFPNDGVRSVYIPKTIIKIGAMAFSNENPIKINVDPENQYFTVVNGALYSKDKKTLYYVPPKTESFVFDKNTTEIKYAALAFLSMKKIVVPGTIKDISAEAFYNSKIENVTIENGVESIDSYAFNLFTSQKLILPSSIKTMKEGCFFQAKIEEVVFSEGTTEIPGYAFFNSYVRRIELPNGITKIGDYAFAGYDLTQLSIPTSVKEIGKNAFYNANFLNIHYSGTKEDWDKITMSTPLPEKVKLHCQGVKVTGIETQDETNISFTKPDVTIELNATTLPSNASNQNITYRSDNSNVAKVEGNKLTSVGEGECKITAYTAEGGFSLVYNVTVKYVMYKLTLEYATGYYDYDGQSKGHEEMMVFPGDEVSLVPQPSKYGYGYQFDYWEVVGTNLDDIKSGDFSSSGQGNIIMPEHDLKMIVHFKQVMLRTIYFSPSPNLTMCPGTTQQLKLKFNPTNAFNKNVKWTSSDPSVMMVDEKGLVTAISPGTAVITATSAEKDSIFTKKNFTVVSHDLTKVEAVVPTRDTEGNIEYYKCEKCGKYFSDPEGKKEIKLEEIILPKLTHVLTKVDGIPSTCTEPGIITHYKCEDPDCGCGKLFEDKYGKKEITAENLVIPAAHKIEEVTAMEPTCTEAGCEKHYKCITCGKVFADKDGKTEIDAPFSIPALGHAIDHLEHVKAVNETYLKDGNIEYYICPRCKKLFKDPECKEEIQLKETIIPHIGAAELGDKEKVGDFEYQITMPYTDGTGTVTITSFIGDTLDVTIPLVVEIKEAKYKVNRIGTGAFIHNATVKTVTIGSNVVIIDNNAFYGCSNLVKVSGGAGVKTIGANAFARCPNLSSFNLSSKVLSKIGTTCFTGDKKLKTLYIKNTTKLTKKGVKKSLKGSKVKTVKVKKSKVKKYKKFFTKKNCGRKVKVKK